MAYRTDTAKPTGVVVGLLAIEPFLN
jgi:hypothetical protein